ncbi:MAG TPA: arylsulfotransferase family protein [Solirubrobacteraceae bacterium]|nr:arylsulfotransferase family protein [Solirubrobacteraceae bacterium]
MRVQIDSASRTLTRRQLLRTAGAGAAGVALAGTAGELLAGALASRAPAAPLPPKWRSRPDLRIPALTVTRRAEGVSEDAIFIAPYNSPIGQAGAVIVDNRGEPIWENPLAGKVTMNFRVQRYRGSPVLTWWEGSIELGHGVGEYVIADAAYRTVRRVQAARGLRGDLHEFVITPRDTALLTSYVVTEADLTAVGGARRGTIQDAIFQEIDLASGRVLLEWHSLDHVALEESYAPVEADWDFFHINSVDVDGDGGLLVSARSTHTIYKVDRGGSIRWRLGGKRGDFAMGPGSEFAWQHDARRQPEGTLTVFDNGATPAVERRSRALILDVDERAMTAALVRQYTHPRILAGSQGSVQLLANGNVFVGWGEAPRVSEFRRSGEIVFDAVLGAQYECYRAFRLPWTGRPAQAPAIAVAGAGRDAIAYASWNGASEVRAWQLLGGAQPNRLLPIRTARSRGFETALATAAASGPCFAVRALDASGAPRGQSRTLALRS